MRSSDAEMMCVCLRACEGDQTISSGSMAVQYKSEGYYLSWYWIRARHP